ncbi:MAG: type II toxin-antitoxin system RelE/ParE family toxin [Caulobacterales bacterium]
MIRYSDAALDDVERLYRWLLDRNPSASRRFLKRLKAAEDFIAGKTAACMNVQSGVARRYIVRFSGAAYVIYFVEDGADQIIVRIWHGREARD